MKRDDNLILKIMETIEECDDMMGLEKESLTNLGNAQTTESAMRKMRIFEFESCKAEANRIA